MRRSKDTIVISYDKEKAKESAVLLHKHIQDIIEGIQAPFNHPGIVWSIADEIVDVGHDQVALQLSALPQSKEVVSRFMLAAITKLFNPVQQLFEYKFDHDGVVSPGTASVWITFYLRDAAKLEQAVRKKVGKHRK